MAAEYQQLMDPMTQQLSGTVLRRSDSAYIPDDPANRDRQEYIQWCEAGNQADPPDEPPAQTQALADAVDVNALAQRLERLERMINAGKEA